MFIVTVPPCAVLLFLIQVSGNVCRRYEKCSAVLLFNLVSFNAVMESECKIMYSNILVALVGEDIPLTFHVATLIVSVSGSCSSVALLYVIYVSYECKRVDEFW